jgi:hypothetical protein
MSIFISIPVIVSSNLITNDATHHGPTDRSNRTAIRQNSASNAANAGADRRILVLL